jgi:hypothetical protein
VTEAVARHEVAGECKNLGHFHVFILVPSLVRVVRIILSFS